MSKASFDWQESLKLSNNKENLAKDLLEMLKQDLPQFQASLKEALQTNNIESLKHHSQKLNGGCCYCGVPRLRQLAEQLEAQIKTHKKEQLAGLVNQIDKEIQNVLTAIKQHKL